MKALLLDRPGHLVFTDVERPTPKNDEVLIEVKACGICGSDIHGFDGSSGRRIPPLIMGHEASGTIVEVGQDVQDWQLGQAVTFDSTLFCGECDYCSRNEVNLCENRQVLGVSCEDYRRHGAFAQHVAVPARCLYRLPDGIDFTAAAFAEPVAIALHAAGRIAVGARACVVGCGMIGLLLIQALRMHGWSTIIGIDLDPAKLALARDLGATHTFSAKDDQLQQRLRSETGSQGTDAAFDVVGIQQSMDTCLQTLRRGGHLVLVGNLSPRVDLPLQRVVTGELVLHGSCASAGEYPEALQAIAEGRINIRPLLSAEAPLAEGAAWFNRLHSGEKGLMKVILKP